MQFRNFAESLLGSRVKIKLLRHILSQETVASERELAALIGVSHAAVNKAMKEFHDMNLLTPLRVGNVSIWNVNKESYAYGFLMRFFYEITKSPKDSLLVDIKSHLAFNKGIQKIILFGSIAQEKETASSDIDLFILVDTDAVRNGIVSQIQNLDNRCLRTYGNKISPNIVTEKEFGYLLKQKRQFIDAVNKGIVVHQK